MITVRLEDEEEASLGCWPLIYFDQTFVLPQHRNSCARSAGVRDTVAQEVRAAVTRERSWKRQHEMFVFP
jgi:hypothetical protein